MGVDFKIARNPDKVILEQLLQQLYIMHTKIAIAWVMNARDKITI